MACAGDGNHLLSAVLLSVARAACGYRTTSPERLMPIVTSGPDGNVSAIRERIEVALRLLLRSADVPGGPGRVPWAANLIEQGRDLAERPDVIGNPSRHRRGALGPRTVIVDDCERLVDPREVVVHVVERNGVRKVLDLL
jgi:hypothetical protein